MSGPAALPKRRRVCLSEPAVYAIDDELILQSCASRAGTLQDKRGSWDTGYEIVDNLDYVNRARPPLPPEGDDDILCDCVWDESGACDGEHCWNRACFIECLKGRCRAGESCLNQRMQRRQFGRTRVVMTTNKGRGVIADEEIKADQFIIEYVGEVLNGTQLEERMMQANYKHFYFMMLQADEFIDARDKGNRSRFMNHSCAPNCCTEKWIVGGEVRIGFFATRDIAKGEELTIDYQWIRVGSKTERCHCGSLSCRGFLGATGDDAESILLRIDGMRGRWKYPLAANGMCVSAGLGAVNALGSKLVGSVIRIHMLECSTGEQWRAAVVMDFCPSTGRYELRWRIGGPQDEASLPMSHKQPPIDISPFIATNALQVFCFDEKNSLSVSSSAKKLFRGSAPTKLRKVAKSPRKHGSRCHDRAFVSGIKSKGGGHAQRIRMQMLEAAHQHARATWKTSSGQGHAANLRGRRPVRVLQIHNLPPATTEVQLNTCVTTTLGVVPQFVWITRIPHAGHPRNREALTAKRKAFVLFSSSTEATQALEVLHGRQFSTRKLHAYYADKADMVLLRREQLLRHGTGEVGKADGGDSRRADSSSSKTNSPAAASYASFPFELKWTGVFGTGKPQQWFDKHSPSVVDGISPIVETHRKSAAIKAIGELCASRKMHLCREASGHDRHSFEDLRLTVEAHAAQLLHRYFVLRSLRQCDAFDVALACVMVACKVLGIPKRLGTLLPLWQHVRKGTLTAGGDVGALSDSKYEALEASALRYEKHLLATLCFDIWPPDPYKLFDKCVQQPSVTGAQNAKDAAALNRGRSSAPNNSDGHSIVSPAISNIRCSSGDRGNESTLEDMARPAAFGPLFRVLTRMALRQSALWLCGDPIWTVVALAHLAAALLKLRDRELSQFDANYQTEPVLRHYSTDAHFPEYLAPTCAIHAPRTDGYDADSVGGGRVQIVLSKATKFICSGIARERRSHDPPFVNQRSQLSLPVNNGVADDGVVGLCTVSRLRLAAGVASQWLKTHAGPGPPKALPIHRSPGRPSARNIKLRKTSDYIVGPDKKKMNHACYVATHVDKERATTDATGVTNDVWLWLWPERASSSRKAKGGRASLEGHISGSSSSENLHRGFSSAAITELCVYRRLHEKWWTHGPHPNILIPNEIVVPDDLAEMCETHDPRARLRCASAVGGASKTDSNQLSELPRRSEITALRRQRNAYISFFSLSCSTTLRHYVSHELNARRNLSGLSPMCSLETGTTNTENSQDATVLMWDLVNSLARDLFRAISWCHQQSIVHRNICSKTIFVETRPSNTRPGHSKLLLGGFGAAQIVQNQALCRQENVRRSDALGSGRETTITSDGTQLVAVNAFQVDTRNSALLRCTAPELLLGASKYSGAVDVWAAGCVVAHMLRGKPLLRCKERKSVGGVHKTVKEQVERLFQVCGTPTQQNWPDVKNLPLYRKLRPNSRYKPILRRYFNKAVPATAIDLVEKCMQLDPSRRISAQQALQNMQLC